MQIAMSCIPLYNQLKEKKSPIVVLLSEKGMLKRFYIENFSSFDDEQSLDLTAGILKKPANHVVDFGSVKLLRSAVLYGANASGKSNLIKAIDFAQKVIVEGLDSVNTYKKHFRLKLECEPKPSRFEFEIEVNDKFYSYGFTCQLKSKQIITEWLFEIGNKEPIKIFERNESVIEVGKALSSGKMKTRFQIYRDDMKNQRNQLFLTEIAGKDLEFKEIESLNNVFKWFENKLLVVYPNDQFIGMDRIDSGLTTLLTEYLPKFDTGVVDLESIEEDFETAFEKFPAAVKADIETSFSSPEIMEGAVIKKGAEPQLLSLFKNNEGDIRVKKIGFIHGTNKNDIFDLNDESDGTRRLIDFIPLVSKFDDDYTILVDEFDRSLHPNLTRAFFELFYRLGKSKSQLIVTTHESTLLDLSLLRRDEIWFVEKSKEGSSRLFTLNQFKERYDKKVEKAYLLGRYGAIPIFGDFNNIDMEKD